jgi:hypothetical protein
VVCRRTAVSIGAFDRLSDDQLERALTERFNALGLPFCLEDPIFIIERFVDEWREHRSISGIHKSAFAALAPC